MKRAPTMEQRKRRAILLSMSVALLLLVTKAVIALASNSLALLASALDSLLDFFSSSINYLSIRIADKPADNDHHFGHGKAEGLAGLFQGLFIIVSAAALVYAAVQRLFNQEKLQQIPLGVGMMVISIVITLWLVRRLREAAVKTESITLKGDALHYATDTITNGGVLIALILIKLTGLVMIDPIVSILITLYILWGAGRLLKEALDELMDKALPRSYQEEVEKIIKSYQPHLTGCHDFRSRRSGSRKLIEFHIEVDRAKSFEEAHELAESLRLAIENRIPNSHITIHYDPAGYEDRRATLEQTLKG
ncbi:MAG: cation diffusion facilitator family transporter [Deltaproteobacteria bacterium]|nr:cation diffusion facilitator family transporter [Deltaproteobacteria bacterium]